MAGGVSDDTRTTLETYFDVMGCTYAEVQGFVYDAFHHYTNVHDKLFGDDSYGAVIGEARKCMENKKKNGHCY